MLLWWTPLVPCYCGVPNDGGGGCGGDDARGYGLHQFLNIFFFEALVMSAACFIFFTAA
jgi:hypothetical protein